LFSSSNMNAPHLTLTRRNVSIERTLFKMASNGLLCSVSVCLSPIVASLLWDTHFLSGFDIFHGWSVLTPFHWKKICICYRPPPCVCIRLCVLLFCRTRRSVPVTGEKRLRKRLDRKTILKPRERKCQGREGGETSLWSTLRDELIGVTRSAFVFFWPEIFVQRRK
jgi:hypothetical protein